MKNSPFAQCISFIGIVLVLLSSSAHAQQDNRPAAEATQASTAPGVSQGSTDELYPLHMYEAHPRLVNVSEFRQALRRSYPPSLRAARVTGQVHARFRIMEDGSVDSVSISILSTTHEEFNEPTLRAVRMLRFRPARVSGVGPVKSWMELPIQWDF